MSRCYGLYERLRLPGSLNITYKRSWHTNLLQGSAGSGHNGSRKGHKLDQIQAALLRHQALAQMRR